MNCPRCADEPLIAVEHERVEVDYCPTCYGVWLDAGELELLYGDAESARAFVFSGRSAPASDKPRRCPECGKRMAKETTQGARPVVVDLFPKGDGLWFDQGELQAILQHAEETIGGGAVATFLQEVFPQGE